MPRLSLKILPLAALSVALSFISDVEAACESLDVRTPASFEPAIESAPFLELTQLLEKPTWAVTKVVWQVAREGCTVTLSFPVQPKVIIMEEATNPCVWAHAMKHEQEHVEIWRRSIDALPTYMKRGGHWGANVDAWAADRAAEHEAHDSPSEYRKSLTACRGSYVAAVRPHRKQLEAMNFGAILR